MDHHQEDIDWQREECILLRLDLQENKDRMGELLVRQQQMSRRLCRCADRQGPPISAVGLPRPPPYARSLSPDFHTPPIEVCPIEDAKDSDVVAERLEDWIGEESALSFLTVRPT